MPLTIGLRAGLRAAAIAVMLGGAAVTAMPAQAAPGDPTFNFQLRIPNGPSVQFRNDGRDYRPDRRRPDFCLSTREIYSQLRDYGFYNIDVGRVRSRNRVDVTASYRRADYRLLVDRCTGRIVSQRRLGPVRPVPPPRDSRPGFGLHFNFGG